MDARVQTDTLSLLIVEDNPDAAELLACALRKAGYRPFCTRVDTEADYLAALDAGPDLVLANDALSRFDGMRALELLRQRRPETPFIFVCATIGERRALAAMRGGADDFLRTDSLDRLGAAVDAALEKARLRAPGRRSEKNMRNTRLWLDAFFEHSPSALFVKDLQGRYLRVNRSFEQALGLKPGQAQGMTDADLHVPVEAGRYVAGDREVIAAGAPREFEASTQLADGCRTFAVVKFPLFGANGAVRAIGGIATDISERKRDADLYRATFNQSVVGIVHTSTKGRFVRANQAFCDLLGYTRDELLARTFMDVTHPEDIHLSDDLRQNLVAHSESEGLPCIEKRYVRKDGTAVWASVSAALVQAADGTPDYFVAMVQDISARHEQELRLARLTRMYAMLSSINSTIVRVRSREQLFEETCRLAVDVGGFKLVYLRLLDEAGGALVPVAFSGPEALRPSVLALAPGDASTATRAFLGARAEICNDLTADPAPGTVRAEAARLGLKSAASLPLRCGGRIIGVLTFAAAEAGVFDPDEAGLLEELAGDVSFALDHLEKTKQIDYLSYYDPLTGLANRKFFEQRMEQRLMAAGESQKRLALVLLDVERFRAINDGLGRQVGDALLKMIAARMTQQSRSASWLGRVGADQFAIFVPDMQSEDELRRRCDERMRAVFGSPFVVDGVELRIAVKLGIALFPNDGLNAELLFRSAETALAKAKQRGERYVFFEQRMSERVAENLMLENKLRRAIEKQEFILHYQPKIDLATRRIVGVEALIRWDSPELGMVPPGDFIPLLEDTGLILPVGAWVLQRAAQDYRAWQAQGLVAPRVAVNVSSLQLRQRDFVDVVSRAIAGASEPARIDFEITESMLMTDVEESIAKLEALRALGIQIAIDDFGTGYSSMAYLAMLPVHALKIDRSFIVAMAREPRTMTLVSTMVSLAHSLRLKVVAEGVDDGEQDKFLRLLRCDEAQGFLYGCPLPASQLAQMLEPRVAQPVGGGGVVAAVRAAPDLAPTA